MNPTHASTESSAQPDSEADAWRSYYAKTRQQPAHETLRIALQLFADEGVEPGLAVDLGCGEGRDALELLLLGWRVLAIDRQPAALELLNRQVPETHKERLTAVCRTLESAAWPPALLVNAGLSLPFCQPNRFPALWRRIRASLMPGGRFAGHLLGERDEWAGSSGLSYHTRRQVEWLLSGLRVDCLQEDEMDLELTNQQIKHWHVFHIVATRI